MGLTDTIEVPVIVSWASGGTALELLDQTLLPERFEYVTLHTAEQVAAAIRDLQVRGAPAIGVVGAMGLALGTGAALSRDPHIDPEHLQAEFRKMLDMLLASRPTGRDLGWALRRIAAVFDQAIELGTAEAVVRVREEADRILEEEVEMCRRIGEAGVGLIPTEGTGILTHCNAGALATGGIGTALAPIYVGAARGIPLQVFACETRPVLQGARLTAWELDRAGIDVTVITDSMAASLMAQGRVSLIVVGADAVTARGDVANKIGTYGLAVLARHHGIPFYVALPSSTFDTALHTGHEIPIEQRDASEVKQLAGRRIAPEGAAAWNPAFDVTPAELVTAFITDRGVLRPPYPAAIAQALAEGEGASQVSP